jgi:hypothetical protein
MVVRWRLWRPLWRRPLTRPQCRFCYVPNILPIIIDKLYVISFETILVIG